MKLNSNRTFNIVAVFAMLYSALAILSRMYLVIKTYLAVRNPLIPDELLYIAAFPLVFIIPIFGFIIWYTLKDIRKQVFNKEVLLFMLSFILLHFFAPSLFFKIIDIFNPYYL